MAVSTRSTQSIVLSIRPKYVEAIMSGSKRYEFRRTIFDDRRASQVYIYCTSPVKKIVAVFEVGEIIEDEPRRLWNALGESSGIKMEEFFEYFCDAEKGYAIGIRNLRGLKVPIDPYLDPEFRPPQSFCYVERDALVPGKMAEPTIAPIG